MEKIELGRHLFYEKQLSANGTQSCGSCHQQHLAFCDGRSRAVGSTGVEHFRNTMGLVNVGYRKPLSGTGMWLRRRYKPGLLIRED